MNLRVAPVLSEILILSTLRKRKPKVAPKKERAVGKTPCRYGLDCCSENCTHSHPGNFDIEKARDKARKERQGEPLKLNRQMKE